MCQALVSIEMMMMIKKKKNQALAVSSWNLSKCTGKQSNEKAGYMLWGQRCPEMEGAVRFAEKVISRVRPTG